MFKKDPDITVPKLFMVGENVPRKWGRQKRGMAPYQHQQWYFWLCEYQLIFTRIFFFMLHLKLYSLKEKFLFYL